MNDNIGLLEILKYGSMSKKQCSWRERAGNPEEREPLIVGGFHGLKSLLEG